MMASCHLHYMNQTMLEIPVSVVISFLGVLCVTISTLAVTVYKLLMSRLKAQDQLLESQGETIKHLQEDVKRLVEGCGQVECHWKIRKPFLSEAASSGN